LATYLLILFLIVVSATAAIGFLLISPASSQLGIQPSPPVRQINIRGGELSDITPTYGFALGDGNLSSPGPTIILKVGQSVIVNFSNIGKIPHTFNIVGRAEEGTKSLWGAEIGNATSPINAGETVSVEFTPEQIGEFSYVCVVPGHISAFKMFGKLIVER